MKTRIAVLLGIFFTLLAWVSPLRADDMVARERANVMRLTTQPCTDERVRAYISADLLQHYKAGTATIDGKTFALCWTVHRGTHIFARYEDGDHGLLPLSDFVREPTI